MDLLENLIFIYSYVIEYIITFSKQGRRGGVNSL